VSGPAPIALEIPSIDVVSTVVPVGVDADQQVVIPEDISQVGWYRFGATPGTGVGSSVIVGHRDGRNFGVGAFYDLERLDVGDPISLTNEAGERVTYQVTGVESVKKAKLPFRELFRETGAETLTLISCIGYYEPGVGYEANIIVSAAPSASVNNSSIDSQNS
jgi:LPXTG-site transpeptidase (sortase) family protein